MNLIQMLKRDEGIIPYAYDDHDGEAVTKGKEIKGYVTIGVGFLVDNRLGGGVPDEVMDFWLDYLVKQFKEELNYAIPFFKDLDNVRQDVLTNMAFQLGVPNLKAFVNTLRLIEEGKYKEASVEMLNSKWARQTPERAKRLSEAMRTGVLV